ncbi:MAG: DUF58 domain-containing protein [Phycisphaeraceae bacterium]
MEIAPAPKRARVTSLLPNDVLARVERMRIYPQKRYTNRSRGEHVAHRSGSSIEFKDYRDYSSGDDIRFVDWNIFSRLHRPYIKLFHEEEEMHIVILVDASNSMKFERKFERAKELAAAFGVMGLSGTEKVSVCAFNQKGGRITRLRPHSGRSSRRALFDFIEKIEAGGDGPVDSGIESMLKEHRGRGCAVVISDFLTQGDLRRSFNLVYSAGLELFALQVLAPTEIEPEVSNDLRLVDSETGLTLDVSSGGDIVKLYQEYREAFQRHIEALATSRSGRMVMTSAKDTLDYVLFDLLRRKAWIR